VRPPLNILHISDVQFGINNRFTSLGSFGEPDPYNNLFTKVESQLERLVADQSQKPHLVIFTGDLVEWGLRSEFQKGLEFLHKIAEALKLDRRKICVVPGNHDINRDYCASQIRYGLKLKRNFNSPWWEKYIPYSEFFQQFYGPDSGYCFTEKQPYTLFTFPEENVVVLGLNSTIYEGHPIEGDDLASLAPDQRPRHLGYLSGDQLGWFMRQLDRVERSWLRIGAVHHHLTPDPTGADKSHLVDVEDFGRKLGPRLHLVLHGHTHDTRRGENYGLHWASIGSASLKGSERPPGEPNCLQLLRFSFDSGVRCQRKVWSYRERSENWSAHPEIGTENEPGIESVPLNVKIHGGADPASGSITKPKDTWHNADASALEMMRSLQEIYQEEHGRRSFRRKRLFIEVTAHCLDPTRPLHKSQPDLLRFGNEFFVDDQPCHCHQATLYWPEDPETERAGPVEWWLQQQNEPLAHHRVHKFPVSPMPGDEPRQRRLLLWFSPSLKQSPAPYFSIYRQQLPRVMDQLVQGKDDWIYLEPLQTNDQVEQVEIVLHVPAVLGDALDWRSASGGAVRIEVPDPFYTPPPGYTTFHVRAQGFGKENHFKVAFVWKDKTIAAAMKKRYEHTGER
jgi:3',5'-cyclic AMP phosphodiesterase CpdA